MIHHASILDATPAQYDVMICDPPYRAHVHRAATSQSAKGGTRSRDLGFDHLSTALRTRIAQLAALAPRWSVIFSDVESIGTWIDALDLAGATYIRTVPWVRWSMPQLSGDRPPQGWEAIILAYGSDKGRKRWNGPGNLTHFTNKCLRGADKHKSEKPLDLMCELVEYFSDEGETILDPTCGRATTLLAAKKMKREAIGYETNEIEVTKGRGRLAAPLSSRDEERWNTYVEGLDVRRVDADRMRSHTAKVRAKLANANAKPKEVPPMA